MAEISLASFRVVMSGVPHNKSFRSSCEQTLRVSRKRKGRSAY